MSFGCACAYALTMILMADPQEYLRSGISVQIKGAAHHKGSWFWLIVIVFLLYTDTMKAFGIIWVLELCVAVDGFGKTEEISR